MNRSRWISLTVFALAIAAFFCVRLLAVPAPDQAPGPQKEAEHKDKDDEKDDGAVISWSEGTLTIVLTPGDTTLHYLRFTSSRTLQNATIELVPELAHLLSVQPQSIVRLPAKQEQLVRALFSLPESTIPGSYDGTIHIRVGTKTIPATLKVIVRVVASRPSVTTTTVGAAGGHVTLPDGIVVDFSAGSLTRAVPFKISSYRRSLLPRSINAALSIYGNVEILPQIPDAQADLLTDGYRTFVRLPLTQHLPAGSSLIVLKQQDIGKGLLPTSDLATVSADGASAAFATREIGLLLLVREVDRGLENRP